MSFKVSLNFFKDKIFAKVLVSHRLHRFSQKFFSKNIFTTRAKKDKIRFKPSKSKKTKKNLFFTFEILVFKPFFCLFCV
ncbi:hypothetical protein C3729_04050 [Cloacibacterium normanense]|uniref:Uncharacterized protein n=1 Tax=Cloacibacterium normanense TaxID=237258 RepID=A0A2S7I6E7_9FLAO|nr:hypothetical protein C3729_04050 [Cloacibacterium normanense]